MRNSYRQVSFLHVYHHSSITIVVAMYAHFDTSGDVYLPVMLNSIVHVIMYGYYFCGAAGFKFQLALRPHITKMQLTQFLIIASQAFMVWSHGGSNPMTMKKAKTKTKTKSKKTKDYPTRTCHNVLVDIVVGCSAIVLGPLCAHYLLEPVASHLPVMLTTVRSNLMTSSLFQQQAQTWGTLTL